MLTISYKEIDFQLSTRMLCTANTYTVAVLFPKIFLSSKQGKK